MPLPADLPNLFSILEVVLRLRDFALVFNRNIGGGLEFDAAKYNITDPDKQLPYAFVVPIDTVGKEINKAEYFQSREAVIGIVICVEAKEHKGKADGPNPVQVVHSFTPLIADIENALLSWQPVGFIMDDVPRFSRVHGLGATNSRAWVMLEYEIPFRFYHMGYGGLGAIGTVVGPEIRADKMKELMVRYTIQEGEFPTVVGAQYFDTVPLTIPATTEQRLEAKEASDIIAVNEAVIQAVADRQFGAVEMIELTQDRPAPFIHPDPNLP